MHARQNTKESSDILDKEAIRLMTIKIGKHSFDGPYSSTDSLEDRSGVYAILCKREKEYHLLDVGESAEVKERVDTHDRKGCWEENCDATLTYAVHYTPNLQQPGRKEIEQEIRDQYDTPCGKT